MIRRGLMAGKTGAVILDRPALVVLIGAMALAAGQLTGGRVGINLKAGIRMAIGAVARLGLSRRMVIILGMAVITGNKCSGLAGIDRVDHIGVNTVMTGAAGVHAVINMLNHHVGIMAVGTAGRRNSGIIMIAFMGIAATVGMALDAVGLLGMADSAVVV